VRYLPNAHKEYFLIARPKGFAGMNATAKAKARGEGSAKEEKATGKAKAKEEKEKARRKQKVNSQETAKLKETGRRGEEPAIDFGCLLEKMPAILGGTFAPIAIMRIAVPCFNHHPPHSQHPNRMNSVASMRSLLWRKEALMQAKGS
jgi:hypothetical protein